MSDDVYDIPDRQAMAAATAEKQQARATEPAGSTDAYYDPAQSQTGNSAYRDYYDMAYNDPYYYNYGRFGFGSGIGSFGPNYGMGLSYGWPTSFGSVSLGYGVGYGAGYGYDHTDTIHMATTATAIMVRAMAATVKGTAPTKDHGVAAMAATSRWVMAIRLMAIALPSAPAILQILHRTTLLGICATRPL